MSFGTKYRCFRTRCPSRNKSFPKFILWDWNLHILFAFNWAMTLDTCKELSSLINESFIPMQLSTGIMQEYGAWRTHVLAMIYRKRQKLLCHRAEWTKMIISPFFHTNDKWWKFQKFGFATTPTQKILDLLHLLFSTRRWSSTLGYWCATEFEYKTSAALDSGWMSNSGAKKVIRFAFFTYLYVRLCYTSFLFCSNTISVS